jgi:hypothetical protein
MERLFLAGVAALFLATGTAHADGFPSNARVSYNKIKNRLGFA